MTQTSRLPFLGVLLLAAVNCLAQMPLPATIQVETQNEVVYVNDVADYSKLDAAPSIQATTTPPQQFAVFLEIGDIVAVNGQPAKGYRVIWGRSLYLRTTPVTGQSPADVNRTNILQEYYEILQPDSTPVGTIVGSGIGGGIPLPGTPSVPAVVYTGGTGAYLGIRGRSADSVAITPLRFASASEDPSVRRTLGGGHATRLLQLNPEPLPQVLSLLHADLSEVNDASPATAGETLIAVAKGLGPTTPAAVPGHPFSTDQPQTVNWPVAVTVNNQPAHVTAQTGWPGLTDVYRVAFVLPAVPAGATTVLLSAAYLPGPSVQIAVQ